jgi:hypothetical protein
MIIKTYINKNLYGKYFLATEAQDDEEVTEEQPKPKRNVKVISVKRSNRGKDFTAVADAEDESPADDATQEINTDTNTDTPNTEETEDNTDFTADVDDGTDDTVEEEPTNDTDDTDFTADADTAEDTTQIDVNSEDSSEDETDFTAGASEEETPTETPDNSTTSTTQNTNAPGVELDSMRKYNLFKEFMSLYNACDNYISKLETVLKNDYEENQIIRISVNNLREMKDIISDYMTIRFRLNSYIQSLLFYQKMIAATQLIFNMLRAVNSKNVI